LANVGTQTFDGKGGTTGTATVSQNGNILKVTVTGTYTVNPNCTGSMTLSLSSPSLPVTLTNHAAFAIDDNGAEVRAIQTDPGAVLTVIGRRQFSVGDWRQ
jgi:galactose mutarotase-like enzyme